jgi:hypothetical protein
MAFFIKEMYNGFVGVRRLNFHEVTQGNQAAILRYIQFSSDMKLIRNSGPCGIIRFLFIE